MSKKNQAPVYYPSGYMVEDSRQDHADLCTTDPRAFGQEHLGRTMQESMDLAVKIADAMNGNGRLMHLIAEIHEDLSNGFLTADVRAEIEAVAIEYKKRIPKRFQKKWRNYDAPP